MSETTKATPGVLNEEEYAALRRAQEAAQAIAARVGRPPDGPLTPMAAREDGESVVFVTVAREFKMNLDHHRTVAFPVGTYLCPTRLALNWWAQANKIVVVSADDLRLAVPLSDLTPQERAGVLRERALKAAEDAKKALLDAQAAVDALDDEGGAEEPVPILPLRGGTPSSGGAKA